MIEKTIYCARCKKEQKISQAKYCCNSKILFCHSCSFYRCRDCFQLRYNSIKQAKNDILSNRCFHCKRSAILNKYEYFYDEKCKQYYCHKCLVSFYDEYWYMVEKITKETGKMPDVLVQLVCGCEVDRKMIINYLKGNCYECSKVNIGSVILLKNQCVIMKSCYQNLESQSISKKLKYKYMLVECCICENFIEGQSSKLGLKVDQFYICGFCLQNEKKIENFYSNKMPKRQEVKNIIKKQQQKIVIKCEQCGKMIQQLIKTQKIYNIKIIDLQQKSKQSVIKNIKDRNIVINLGKKKLDNKQIKQQKLQQSLQIKNMKEVNKRLNLLQIQQSNLKHQQIQQIQQNKNQQQILNQQFLKVQTYQIILNDQQQKLGECNNCKINLIQINLVNVYQKQLKNGKILRMQDQQQKVDKQKNNIFMLCKICYLSMKIQKIKLQKQQQIIRYQKNRYGYSAPKKQSNKYNSSNSNKPQFKTILLSKQQNKNIKQFQKLSIQKNQIEPKKLEFNRNQSNSRSFFQKSCQECKKFVNYNQFNFTNNLCLNCLSKLNSSKNGNLFLSKCLKCKKQFKSNYRMQNYCNQCLR